MSFEIDGTVWEPETTSAHAVSIMNEINSLLQENSVKDSSGNIIQLSQNFANALYLLVLGSASVIAENDVKLENALNSFNIELCDDQQIENLLPIAAVSRNPGSYSTLTLTATASSDGNCTIPKGTKAPYGDVNFVVDNDVLISAGQSQEIATTCDTLGAIAVLTGEVTSFEGSIVNLEKVENLESSVPGTAAETTNELRQRLLSGSTIKYSLDGCKDALEELTGVSYARVYFNYNTDENIELAGGVEVLPRHSYIVIHGASTSIASTYASYMSAPTQNADGSDGTKGSVVLTITASSDGDVSITMTDYFMYENIKWYASEGASITAGESANVVFTASVAGDYEIPAETITALDTAVENIATVVQSADAVPGNPVTADEQDYVTASGQAIPIYYDNAGETKVYVKIVLKEDADSGTQVDNQLRRDLITASASWQIGEPVTSLLTGTPFADITYTDVAYTQVSTDGETWGNVITVPCNSIPRVSDATISVESIGE